MTTAMDSYLSVVIKGLRKMSPKLEPCAHCGASAEAGIEDAMSLNVECRNLKCRSKMVESYIDDVSPERACKVLEKRWNRRILPQQNPATTKPKRNV